MKKLMLGNEAVAEGIYESGCKIVSSYPGTPSTEITEYAAKYNEVYTEWAPNEKVAVEVAIGASIGGSRAFSAMKHVGLNVAADPLFTAAYTGVNGGLVIAVADDPGMHSSQNEQDSRHYAIAAKIPMLEPADSEECLLMTKQAFELSEKFDTPILLRLTTRISHSQSALETGERVEYSQKPYVKNSEKFVMVPANARARHIFVEERMNKFADFAETSPLNTVEDNKKPIGVICSGICYQYAKEALGDSVSYLKLGIVNPLPTKLIKDFAAGCEKVYVIEELDPVIESWCKNIGVDILGKECFTLLGEYSASMIGEVLNGQKACYVKYDTPVPVRPPVLCPGCPHRGMFYVFKKLGLMVNGDIGCYALGIAPPLAAIDTTVCMGYSVSGIHGFDMATDKKVKSVAILGDSTFMHSGMTGLVNIAYNQGTSTVVILDNSITGMTGHQQNPTTGFTLKGNPTVAIDLESLCRSIGINRITVVDPYDLERVEKVLLEETSTDEPSVVIARRPCILLKTAKILPAKVIDPDKCKGCKACLKVGCPCISFNDKKAHIDPTLCVGCDLCEKLCKFDAIGGNNND
ncbi:MAG: indolepyruvate ferredoxin oxidoreductase subunit alpha [Clostridiales bacterium]|nr:MAG: indolepyruvate ferredoxin oxidoreductase subunit alpha [Clostridiales bacterium]